ncbi:MAG TPA: protein kinase [Thermoanaerobaculia bacterium]|jgi:serine/threonine-protein kinase|nr:protein kinase [Thermoanaerobaculia bacterium]
MEGTRVGPYLITGPLGAGGMGVVYEAWDERLERSVAIKRVTPDPTGAPPDPRRRERLRREARAAGRLSHPAIVQIYDVVETEEADWIVLELVEGPTLAELLRQGPLPLSRLLPLAREIAEGLAEAHDRGILHRDLKAENVVVTRAGHAKILDFGLAKRFWPAAPGGGDALSRAGEIVGTPRAMSPEQANGEALDPRSDLYSLGTLLYEAVTGVLPFQAATPVETLHRVCTHQPRPAAELNPAVPRPLSALIRELLEKDRERRPANAHAVADRLAVLQESRGSGARLASGSLTLEPTLEPTVLEMPAAAPATIPPRRAWMRWAAGGLALLLLAAAGLAWFFLHRREPLYVAVAEPQVQAAGDGGETELAAAGLRAALLRDLSSFERIAVLTPEPGGAAAPRALARQLAADEVLVPRLDCAGRACRVSLSRLQAADGRLLWSESFEAPTDDLLLLATAAGPVLRRGYSGFSRRPGASGPEIGREDWERFVRLEQDSWEHRGNSPSERLLADVEVLRRQAPRFVEILLLDADLYLHRFFASRDSTDAERARGLLAEARRLAPGDPRPLWLLARVALNAGSAGDTEAAVAELAKQIPGDNRVQVLQALLDERRGRPDEALERMRAAARRRPGQSNLLGLANLESRLGRMDDARRTLAALLARFPNDRNARSFLAQLELGSGSVETAARLYAELVRAEPTFTELTNLGVAQLLLGRYDAAAASFQQALALLPASPAAVLNLADAEWLRGQRTEAAALYEKVIDRAAHDPAPAFWQTQTLRAQALAHLGRREEAVDAVQQALRAAPDNPQVAYESSLVYALVGETASARVTAQRARAAGYDQRWFSFPWFDSLGRER